MVSLTISSIIVICIIVIIIISIIIINLRRHHIIQWNTIRNISYTIYFSQWLTKVYAKINYRTPKLVLTGRAGRSQGQAELASISLSLSLSLSLYMYIYIYT